MTIVFANDVNFNRFANWRELECMTYNAATGDVEQYTLEHWLREGHRLHTLLLCGPTATELALEMAKCLARMYHRGWPPGESGSVIVVNTLEELQSAEDDGEMRANVPIVFDNVRLHVPTVFQCMSYFNVRSEGLLLRYRDLPLQSNQVRIFTTNGWPQDVTPYLMPINADTPRELLECWERVCVCDIHNLIVVD